MRKSYESIYSDKHDQGEVSTCIITSLHLNRVLFPICLFYCGKFSLGSFQLTGNLT